MGAGGKANRVKNQHYVPQSYLERFTAESGNVFVFDKPTRKVFLTSARNIASENGFYDLPPDASADAQAVEKAFSKLEGDTKGAIDDLIEEIEKTGSFDAHRIERRVILATFIALQDTRTLAFRQSLSQVFRQLTSKLNEVHEFMQHHHEAKGERVEVQPVDLGYSKERESTEHASFMFDPHFLERAVKVLVSHIWLVFRNDLLMPLYTSDSPVYHHPHVKHWAFGGAGLAAPGVEIGIPLSPKYVLALFERTYFEPAFKCPEGSVQPLEPDGVKFYNFHQIWASRRHIYCSQDQFEHVREFEAKNTEAFNVERPRFHFGS